MLFIVSYNHNSDADKGQQARHACHRLVFEAICHRFEYLDTRTNAKPTASADHDTPVGVGLDPGEGISLHFVQE